MSKALELSNWLYAQAKEWTAEEIDDAAVLLRQQHEALKVALKALELSYHTTNRIVVFDQTGEAIKQIKELL